MILGGQKEYVRFDDEGFAYTFELTRFAYMWLNLTEMPCSAAAPSATLAVSVTGGVTDQITTSNTAQRHDVENNSCIEVLPIGLVFHIMVTCGGVVYTLGDCADVRKYVSNTCKYCDGREDNWTLTGKISIPMDATALITKGKKSS